MDRFADRREAGRMLAAELSAHPPVSPVVLGLPRGGVPVAAEVARALSAPLDVLVVRKLGVPWHPEVAMGAVGEDGAMILNRSVTEAARVPGAEIQDVRRREEHEVAQRVERFRLGRPAVELSGRTAIVVDDGVATGATAKAGCAIARARGAASVVLAVPVVAPDALRELEAVADRVVCLQAPEGFMAAYGGYASSMDAEIFYVLVGSVAVAAVARWRGWPAPLLVTVVALAASFVPGAPVLDIDGHVLLNLVLPPLLYSAALDVSFVGFRRSLPQIRRLGVWLVLLTAVAVGFVAWWIMPSLTLPGALLLGAIVAPPDAVSAAAIGRRLGLPRRIMTVLSGESLINDASSLTLYRVFAAILAGSTVGIWDGVGQFLLAVGIGVAIGLVFGIVLHQLRTRIADPVVIGTFGLLAPFGAYAIAEHLLGSGVLAVVAMGLYVGFNAPRTDYTTRQQEAPLWLSADLLLESFVFAYIGLQFPRVLADIGSESTTHILLLSGAVLLVVLIVRPLYIYPTSWWANFLDRRRLAQWDEQVGTERFERRLQRSRRYRNFSTDELRMQIVRERMAGLQLGWKDNAVISWAGMRGVVTLAIALAAADLATLDDRASHAIVVVAFIVTVGTLLLQGLTLPLLIRSLGITSDGERAEDEQALAEVREKSREAGKAYLAQKRVEWEAKYGSVDLGVFDGFAKRMTRVERDTEAAQEAEDAATRPSYEDLVAMSKGWLHVRREILLAERDAGNLDEELMRELIAAIDAEELALDTRGATRSPGRA